MTTTSIERVSAKIYQFPVNRVRTGARPAVQERLSRAASQALDSCWYHDEAIREEQKPLRD